MTQAQRREGRALLAMLLIGALLTIGSGLAAIGFVVTMLLRVLVLLAWPGWLL
ncbi:hypothetical protein [Sphingomonas sp. Leaf343]|uniref:hypothetical protein n=1 Tax=Sphingomonas sp. Leaf343 TaxID=1736345 RepID=UPI000AAAB782|nr:hypothetical protein [Sphingomonas sp. Leaf343]